jgi:hypothetical protein
LSLPIFGSSAMVRLCGFCSLLVDPETFSFREELVIGYLRGAILVTCSLLNLKWEIPFYAP